MTPVIICDVPVVCSHKALMTRVARLKLKMPWRLQHMECFAQRPSSAVQAEGIRENYSTDFTTWNNNSPVYVWVVRSTIYVLCNSHYLASVDPSSSLDLTYSNEWWPSASSDLSHTSGHIVLWNNADELVWNLLSGHSYSSTLMRLNLSKS